jgi:ABC-2 type transport system permease protein
VFAGCAFVLAALAFGLNSNPAWRGLAPMIGWGALFFGAYVLVIGPQFARQDIRSDLAHADILKTYPLAGWQIVLGELLTPVALLTGVTWLALLTFTLTFQAAGGSAAFGLWARLACAFWVGVCTPVLIALQLLVPNGAALVFPAWFQVSRGHGGGPEVAGQRMLFFFAQALTMALALLPPAGIALGALMVCLHLLDFSLAVAVHLSALPFLGILIGEVWCGIWLLGERFEQFDLSSELRS